MVTPLLIHEGTVTNRHSKVMRFTSAIYPPQFYDCWQSWASALKISHAPDAAHFGYGKNAEHAIQRALEEVHGFVKIVNVHLVNEDGFDFATFTELGYKLPWDDDIANHPALASYAPPPYEPKIHPTPNAPPIRLLRGWQTLEGEMREVVGAIYPPDRDADGHWGCVVSCPAIFDSNKRISGVDAEQSLELAEWLLIDLWNHFIEPKVDQIERTYAARFR